MKKNILLLLMLSFLFMAVGVQAQDWCVEDSYAYEENCCVDETHFYAKILGGVNFLQNTVLDGNRSTYQTGYIIAGSLGYYLTDDLCVEFEYAFRRDAIKKIDFFVEGSSTLGNYQASSCMVNLLWDLPLPLWECALWECALWKPFIGAGIGCDFQRMHASNSRIVFHQKWNHFSWQMMTGLTSPFFCDTEITLEYKFHHGGSHFYNHSLGVGLVYKFGL